MSGADRCRNEEWRLSVVVAIGYVTFLTVRSAGALCDVEMDQDPL